MGSAASISAAEVAAGIGSTILAVQLLTPADPIGKTWQLIRQFRKQVRRPREGMMGTLKEERLFGTKAGENINFSTVTKMLQ